MPNSIFTVMLVGLLLLPIALLVRSNRRQKGRIQQLASSLGSVPSGSGGAGVCDGIAYRFAYSRASRNKPAALKVSIESPMGQPFQVMRAGRAERLSKRIGLSAEIQTGDQSFDAEFYVETDAVEFIRSLLRRDESRDAVRAIFRLGFTAVHQDGQLLQAVWSPFKLSDAVDSSLITAAIAPLATLARNVPLVPAPAAPPRILTAKAIGGLPVAIMVALVGLSLGAAQFRPLDDGAVMRDSLHYSVPALLLWLWFVFTQLRGRSTAPRKLAGLAIISVVGFVLGGNSLETIVNGWTDGAPPSSHAAPVIRTYRAGGRSTTYHVVVRSWRPSHQAETLIVSSDAYSRAQPQLSLTVVTKPGRLGFEWVVGYTLGNSHG